MFEKLPFYGQVLVMVALGLLIVALVYWILPLPSVKTLHAERDRLQASLEEKNQEIRRGQTIEARLPELEREIENLERKLGDLAQILPTSPETGDLLQAIKSQTDQSNLDLKSFGPQPMRPVEFYLEFPIDMQIVGRYHDLGLFLDRISKYARVINVDNLAISSVGGVPEKSIQATFTATTFVYDERDEGAEETP
jgi:type IV pilus assembly protein PilO